MGRGEARSAPSPTKGNDLTPRGERSARGSEALAAADFHLSIAETSRLSLEHEGFGELNVHDLRFIESFDLVKTTVVMSRKSATAERGTCLRQYGN